MMLVTIESANSYSSKEPFISKWYRNKKASISLRFDDSTKDHVKTVIPLLDKYQLTGIFMINPGRPTYQKQKKFWECEFTKTKHKLGNHTWNHKGAKTLKEADFEIGAAARLIWKLYPNDSKLMVFASGGGEKWNGHRWSDAGAAYKSLLNKYHLIDLYDGKHPSLRCDSNKSVEDLCKAAKNAIESEIHQPFHFHTIGTPYTSLRGIVRGILYGHDIAFARSKFETFLLYLSKLKKEFWNAPLIDILKYQFEYEKQELIIAEKNESSLRLKLKIKSDPKFYDQQLTLVLPETPKVISAFQKIGKVDRQLNLRREHMDNQTEILPINSDIIIKYKVIA